MSTSKRNISGFGKTFEYLKDPAKRAKETGNAPLVVQDAEIGGVSLQYLDWRNITFKNCDFVGAYQIKMQSMVDVRFEGCRFAGIFGFGRCERVRFMQCGWAGNSVSYAGEKSKGVTFEKCTFIGTDSNANHWGGVGSDGEAEFIECVGQWFNVQGHAKLTMRDCEFRDVRSTSAERESGGVFADALIERCKLRGTFEMKTADLQSLTIRDTQIDVLDLDSATVKGDILIERVKATSVRAGVMSVRNFTLRDCQLVSSDDTTFLTAVQAAEQLVVDNCSISGGMLKGASLGAGRPLEDNEWSAVPRNKYTLLRNSKLSYLNAAWFETQRLRIENTSIERADMSNARIGAMEFDRATFTFTLNLSQTQVKEFQQSGGTNLSKLGGFKAEGANVKLPR